MKKNILSSHILGSYSTLFFVLGIISLVRKELIAVDNFIASAFCILFIFINKKHPVNRFTAFLAGFVFVPHIAGNYGLYELASLNYHYDWIVHFLTSFFSSLMMLNFLFHKDYFLKKFFIASLIAVSITMTFGAVIEISEYWGFRTIGLGEGYLGFGEGDNSQNFGPWENSSLDSTLNFIGSLFAVAAYGIFAIIKDRLRAKKQDL
jgi:hypothetical protein